SGSNNISIIDVASNQVIDVFPTDNPTDMDFDSNGSTLYVTSRSGGTLRMFDTNNNSQLNVINIGSDPIKPIVGPNDLNVYVTLNNSILVRYNIANDQVNGNIPVGAKPIGAVMNSEGTKIYIANQQSDNVGIFKIATAVMDETVSTGEWPYWVDLSPDGEKLVVTNIEGNSINIISTNTNTTLSTLAVGNSPRGVCIISQNLPGNNCHFANDINNLFGQGPGQAQISTLWDNSNSYTSNSDPSNGYECFEDFNPALNKTVWFSFVGDGNTYTINTVECNASNYISNGDTQIALYSGSCDNLNSLACSEDEDYATSLYNAKISVATTVGESYFVMVDGYGFAEGEFCLEVTRQGSTGVTLEDFVGTWRIAPQAGALAVGPTLGSGEWWSNSLDDVNTRACFFDDTFIFFEDGSFKNEMGDETWLEPWQGVDEYMCGVPVYPHDGSVDSGTWNYAGNKVTIGGYGLHLGIPKVVNNYELEFPGNALSWIQYDLYEMTTTNPKMMTLDISITTGWWRFVLVKDEPVFTSEINSELFGFYPNPASDFVQINSTEVIDMISIKDIAGKEVMVKSVTSSNASINVTGLNSGVYLLECRSADKRSIKKLLVK
ncbi:MAG: T9SS type A sorting domain-containing protein, partial [Saprospiraceae bacterium]